MNVNAEFSKYFKGFKTSESILVEIKYLKKINTLINKLLKTKKDHYKSEILNYFKIVENNFEVTARFVEMIKENYLDKKNLKPFDKLYREYHEQI